MWYKYYYIIILRKVIKSEFLKSNVSLKKQKIWLLRRKPKGKKKLAYFSEMSNVKAKVSHAYHFPIYL
jgi:hypothetical protein